MTDASVWEACTIIRSRRGLRCQQCPHEVQTEEFGALAPLCRIEAEAVVDQQREWD